MSIQPVLTVSLWTLCAWAWHLGLRGLRWHQVGGVLDARSAVVGWIQDLGFSAWVGAVATLLHGISPGLGALGFMMMMAGVLLDHGLFARVGVRLQPAAFASAADLRSALSSGLALFDAAQARMAVGVVVTGVAAAALLSPGPANAAFLFAAAGVLLMAGSLLGVQHPASVHWCAVVARGGVLRRLAGGEAVSPFEPKAAPAPCPLWRATRPSRPRRDLDVYVVLMESFAAQHVGACGAAWGATPGFDRWAERGLFCPRAYGNGVQTVRALVAATTGAMPRVSVRPLTADADPPRLTSLAHILGNLGWDPQFWHNGQLHFHGQGAFLEHLGFRTQIGERKLAEQFPDAPLCGSWGLHDEVLFEAVAQAALKSRSQPLFALILSLSHHHPWRAPAGWLRSWEGATGRLAGFLDTLHYSDACLGGFLDTLEREGRLQNSVVVVVGDHGSPTGQDNMGFDNLAHLAEHGTRVPMLVLAPDLEPEVRRGPVSQVDILPTVLDLLGVSAHHHALGESLLGPVPPVLTGNPFGGGWFAMHEDQWKIVFRAHHEAPLLFNVETDCREEHDLSAKHPELAASLAARCLAAHRAVAALHGHNRWCPDEQARAQL